MSAKNICKFTTSPFPDMLAVPCFVLESDPKVMATLTKLREHRLFLITQGSGNFVFDQKKIPFRSGALVFGFRGETFVVESAEPSEFMYLDFSGARAEELIHRFGISRKNRSFEGFDGLIPLWRESLSTASGQTIDLAAESILLYTFSRLFSNLPQYDPLISKIVEITEKQFSDPELSVSTLSEQLGYNPKYVSHIFKKKMGVSYSEYLRNLRIKYAVSLFDHGIDSVKNVALLSGFLDPLYFSAVFKKCLGVSPSEYKAARKDA